MTTNTNSTGGVGPYTATEVCRLPITGPGVELRYYNADEVAQALNTAYASGLASARAEAGKVEAARDNEELGWAIERHVNGTLLYWDGRGFGSENFSTKNLDAVRFAREQDAAMVLGWPLGGNGRVTQHMWVGPRPHTWVPANDLVKHEHCRACGIIARADGGNRDKPCKGPVRVGPRDTALSALQTAREGGGE